MTPVFLDIAGFRKARGLSQAALAELAGVSRVTVNQIERRQTKGVDFATLEALARVLGVSPSQLIAEDHVRRPGRGR